MNLLHLVVCGCALLPMVADAQGTGVSDAALHLQKLIEATLDREGLNPWHLRMTFQLNDMYGKAQDSGSIEEWWVSPTSRRIEVKSGLLNQTFPAPAGAPVVHSRESYFVGLLLQQVVHPMPDLASSSPVTVTEEHKKLFKTDFRCFQVNPAKAKSSEFPILGTRYCAEVNADVLRVQLDPSGLSTSRNKMGFFRNVSVALEDSISFGDKVAIVGHVEALEGYDPVKQPLDLASGATPAEYLLIPASGGEILKKAGPVYPPVAKQFHKSGSVILCAVITKEGTVGSVDVLASPFPALTAAAMDAARQWVYKPFLLNGEAVEVETTIVVSFGF